MSTMIQIEPPASPPTSNPPGRTPRAALLGLTALALVALATTASAVENPPGDIFDPFFRSSEDEHKVFSEGINGDQVDPFTGTLRIVQEDLVLPGRAGHDLRIVRTYSSKLWGRTDLLTPTDMPLLAESEHSVLGYGWNMHFGRLRGMSATNQSGLCSADYPVFEAPDGSSHVFYPVRNAQSTWVSKDFWKLDGNCPYAPGGNGSCVWSDTGVRYEFTKGTVGYFGASGVFAVDAIVDVHGNAITINYLPPGGYPTSNVALPPVSSVVDSYGREVSFDYTFDVDGARLRSITANNRVYSYAYDAVTPDMTVGSSSDPNDKFFPFPGTVRRFLRSVTPPAGPGYSYQYGYNLPVSKNRFALTKITYPGGASATYAYAPVSVFTGSGQVPLAMVASRTVAGRGLTPGTWTYTYKVPMPGEQTGTDPRTREATNYNVTTVKRPDGKYDVFSFFGFGWAANRSATGGFVWMMGLTRQIAHGAEAESGLGAEFEQSSWTSLGPISANYVPAPNYGGDAGCPAIAGYALYDEGVFLPVLAYHEVFRDPDASGVHTASFETFYSEFDQYGQARKVEEQGIQSPEMGQTDPTGTAQVVRLKYGATVRRTTDLTYFSRTTEGSGADRTINLLRGRPTSRVVRFGSEESTSTWTYDGPGFARDSETLDGITKTFAHDPDGNLSAITNARLQTVTLSNYQWGVATRINLPGGISISRAPTWEGWLESETNGRGFKATYGYDAIGRVTSVVPPLAPQSNPVTTTVWEPDNSKMTVSLTGASGAPTYTKVSKLDGLGRVVRTEDSQGVATTARYDAMGRRWFTSYPFVNGTTTDEMGVRLVHDALGRPLQVSKNYRPSYSSPSTEVLYEYKANCVRTTELGLPEYEPSTLQCFTSFGSPAQQSLSSMADGLGNIWQFGSGVTGKLEVVEAPLAKGYRRNLYGAFGSKTNLLLDESTGESGTTHYTYNPLGQVETRTDAMEVVQTFAYDQLSRLTGVSYTGPGSDTGDDITRLSDEANNVTDISSAAGGAIHTGYDELNRVTAQTWSYQGQVHASSYHYDQVGCLDRIDYPTGDVVTMTCDAANRARTIRLNETTVVSDATYSPTQNTVTYGDGPGTVTTTSFDERGRVATISAPGLTGLTYTYDEADNVRTYANAQLPGSAATLHYDQLHRLFWVENKVRGTTAYDYDGLGNRTGRYDEGAVESRYDDRNRLEATWVVGAERFNSLRLNWNVAGQLIATSDGASYRYDGLGRRVLKTAGGATTLYHHDPAGRVIAETDGTGAKQRIYIYLGNKLVVVDGCPAGAAAACGERQWYQTDALGSVVARTDSGGNVVARLDYEPWGEQRAESSTGPGGDRQYNGRVFDPGTGFHDYGARLYWPQIGRFVSADSYKGDPSNPASLNLYSYVHNNPYKYTDPTGHCPMCAIPVLIGLLFIENDQHANLAPAAAAAFPGTAAAAFNVAGGASLADGNYQQAEQYFAGALLSGVAARGAAGAGAGARAVGDIKPGEVIGKTPSEIGARAQRLGLVPRGPAPEGGRGSYIDPKTGKQRILVHPEGESPHGHVNNPAGKRLGPDGSVVPPESPAAHLPIKTN